MALGDPSNDNATKWQSVACSGAQMVDVSPQDKDSDRGQGSRLKDISNHAELKSQALNEFIPGRVKQIEFVRKYKPKVISLTMGGNDVGFAKVIEACATPLTTTTTCKYVGEGRPKVAKDILDRYGALKKLYEDIYNESGKQAKIYVLGYPQFINDSNPAQCGQNIGFINAEEREMISNAVTLMNRVISQAAMAAGVKYIDIEDSLDGGRLCDDGQRYVTGMVGVPVGISNELHESFHPNAKGHFEIAMTTWDAVNHESLLDYDTCPASQENRCPNATATKDNIVLPSYFDEVSSENSYYTTITAQQASKENPLEVKIEPYSLRPQSSANITLHSDPVNLGDFTVSTDGSLNEDIVIPSTVPAGYHTLIVAGKTYSGEPVQYEQIVLVTGANPDDLDEDGASDTSQPCGPFMVASGQDADLDGIDDACDPEISDTSQLYRVRQGDPSRTYDNQPEKDYYLYIERNTHASSLTGINGDYDPDGDGWAIVGASQGKQYTSTSVPDTGPAANFTVAGNGTIGNPYQPIVSIRAGGWGCATYRPTSLGKVTPGQVRTFTRVAVNTDTCRQELPEDDIDGNAIADNVQPLYVARNGNSTKGEDPARIYLYRNFYASEAQLGISDYTSTGTAANTIAALPLIPTIGDSPNHPTFGAAFSPIQQWNLLSISKANEYIPPFNKLVILQDGNGSPLPTILTKKLNGQCIAYQPSNTSVIKFIQQNNLVKLAGLPGGVNCE